MPRKTKPVVSPDEVWIAPRPADEVKPLAFEPVGAVRSNRYLDFADIALGRKPSSQKKPDNRPAHGQKQRAEHARNEGKVTPINKRASGPRGQNEGFGAFRNPR